MKRLGLYVILSAMTILVVAGFMTPKSAFAQTTLTHDSAKQIVGTLFDQMIAAGPYELATSSVLTTDAGKQRHADGQILVPRVMTIVENAKSIYASSYDTTLSPAEAQIKALVATETALNNTSSGMPAVNAQVAQKLPAFSGVIRTFRFQLQSAYTQANEIKNNNTSTSDLTNPSAISNASTGSTPPKSLCSLFSPTNITACIDEAFAWLIKNTLLKIAGFLVWFAANVLNFAVQIGVLNFKDWAPDPLYAAWVVVRQIVSLFIVFAGLYLGFLYIIGKDKAFENFFPWLILFALFVNFSYPLTRAAIDITNVVALNIYSSTVGPEALTWNISDVLYSNKSSPGTLIMNNLGLQQLVASATVPDTGRADLVGSINSTAGALMTVVFVFYAAYVFFMAAGIIIFRTAILVFLTIASPLLFVDSVIPILGEKAKQLRKLFFEQLVVAPVFMIMLALTMKFISVFTAGPNAPIKASAGLITGGGAMITAFFGVFMMLVMLHIALKVTRSLAGSTGEAATNFMGKVGGFGLGVASGGAGLLARGTLGKVAASARSAQWMDKIQGSRMGRGLYSLTNSMANSTYDTRNIGAVSQGLTKAGMGSGFMGVGGMGKGSEMTTDKLTEQRGAALTKKYASIKDGDARQKFLKQKEGVGRWQTSVLGIKSDQRLAVEKIEKENDKKINYYKALKSEDRKLEYFESLPENLQKRLEAEGFAPGAKAVIPEDARVSAPADTTAENDAAGSRAFDLTATSLLARRQQKQTGVPQTGTENSTPGNVTPPPGGEGAQASTASGDVTPPPQAGNRGGSAASGTVTAPPKTSPSPAGATAAA